MSGVIYGAAVVLCNVAEVIGLWTILAGLVMLVYVASVERAKRRAKGARR